MSSEHGSGKIDRREVKVIHDVVKHVEDLLEEEGQEGGLLGPSYAYSVAEP